MSSPREIVDIRLARGEINLEEHERIVSILDANAVKEAAKALTEFRRHQSSNVSSSIKIGAIHPEKPSETNVPPKSTKTWKWLLFGLLSLVLFIVIVMVADDDSSSNGEGSAASDPKRSTGRWVFSDDSTSSRTRRYVSLVASQSTGSSQTTIRMSCTKNGMGVEVIWGEPLKNLYPNESVPTATRVFAKFGNSAVWDMAWQPVSNSTVTREPSVQLDISSNIDSAIFSLLGMESISKKNKDMFDWTPEQFFNRMAKQEHVSKNPILKLSAKTAGNQNLTSVFDLTGFNEIAKQKFGGVCVR